MRPKIGPCIVYITPLLLVDPAAGIHTICDAQAGTAVPGNEDCTYIIHELDRALAAGRQLLIVWVVPTRQPAGYRFLRASSASSEMVRIILPPRFSWAF